ncbi:MAG: DUF4388 domain-containing protein [Anaerolineae bacterium]
MTVRGNLREMSLTGLISLNCNEGNRAHLHLLHGEQEAHIYFDEGEIVHLVLGDREGEEGMQEILEWDAGTFELEMHVPPPRRTVHVPWHSLVLQSMHTLDEEMAPEAADQMAALEAAIAEDTLMTETTIQQSIEEITPQEVNPMAELRDLLKEMAAEIPGFQAAAVAGIDGLAIAEYRAAPDFNLEMATAQFALVMKLVDRTMGRLKSGNVEDNLVTTDTTYILSRLLGDGSSYLVIAVEREMASLGNVRLMTRNFASDLWGAIPRR